MPLLTFCGTFSNKVRCLKQDKARDRIVLLIKLCTLSVQPKRDKSSDRDAFFFSGAFVYVLIDFLRILTLYLNVILLLIFYRISVAFQKSTEIFENKKKMSFSLFLQLKKFG